MTIEDVRLSAKEVMLKDVRLSVAPDLSAISKAVREVYGVPEYTWKPLGDWYYVRLLDEEDDHSAGGVYLPETTRTANNTDGEVLAVGPGTGRAPDMQAAVGERIIFEQHAFKRISGSSEGFVNDRDIIARVLDHGSDYWLQPCGPWVVIEPEVLERVTELPSGLCLASYSLPGGEARERANRGDPDAKYLTPLSQTERPRRGRVIATGPGHWRKDHRVKGCLWELLGARVHWAKELSGVELQGPTGRVILLREDSLLCVEDDRAENEASLPVAAQAERR